MFARWLPAALFIALAPVVPGSTPSAQSGSPEQLPGAVNYTRVDAVVACGGTTEFKAFDQLKEWGFRSVLNLRETGEPGARVEEEGAVVEGLGMKYLHIPFNSTTPSAEAVERFIAALDESSNLPVYIHCGTANRVGAMWYAKRVIRDGWPAEKAMAEAEAVGLRSPALREFIVRYVQEKVR